MMRYISQKAQIKPSHNIFLVFIFVFSLSYGSYAINPWDVVENSELIAECKFKGYIDTTCFGKFEIKHIYKGSLNTKQIAVYLFNIDEVSRGPIKASNRMLLVLNSRKHADLSVQMKFDQYHVKGSPLFIPAMQPASYMAIFDLDSLTWKKFEMERLLWINEVIGLNKEQRRHKLIASLKSANEHIRFEAIRTLADDINAEIQKIPLIEDRASLYASLLDTTSNRNVELYALKFFMEYYYPPAIAVLYEKIKQLPDSACFMLKYYIDMFKKYPDSIAANLLLAKITNTDFLKYQNPDYGWPNYGVLSVKDAETIGELVNQTLSYRKDDIFENLYKEIAAHLQDSVYIRSILPLMLGLFKSYMDHQRTKLLMNLYDITGKSEILSIMASGGEKSALTFLLKAAKDSTYDIYAVLSALSNYTDPEVGSLLVDIIQKNKNHGQQNSAVAALTSVLSHTDGNPTIKTVRFICEKLKSMDDWDTRKNEVWKMIDLISASKSDTIVNLLIDEIKRTSVKEKRKALTRKLDPKFSKRAFDYLYFLMLDKSEDIDVRQAALWQFASYQDTLIQNAIVNIAISNDEDMILQNDAVRILKDYQKKPLPAKRIPNTFITKINELYAGIPRKDLASYYGSDFKINFEGINQIGAAWYNYAEPNCWAYNYVRFDTAGNILIDVCNFDLKDIYWEKFNYLADPYNPNPHLEYLTDDRGNSIIAYKYADDQPGERWKLAWLKVDTLLTLSHNIFDGTSGSNTFTICSSKKYDFHMINGSEYREQAKPERVHFLDYSFSYQKKHLIPPDHYIETGDNNLLCLSQYHDSAEIHYQCISPKGKFLFGARPKINQVTAVIWDNVELPDCEELFQWNDSIWYITLRPSSHFRGRNRLILIRFDKKGRIVKQKTALERGLLSIDSIPRDSKRFINVSKDIIYYYGLDHDGNLYYWNSKWGYIDYNRADILAPLYSIHFNNVRDSIYNPATEDNLYPDSMTGLYRWSKGGKLKYDMKLLIGCNKQDKTYTTGELIGIRCGIIHAILNEKVYLAKAYYSPNKIHWPPEITVYINGPTDAGREKLHLIYMGDDVISSDRPKVDSVNVPAGRIFNPSPDNLFYNMWAGIYRFESPGIYRIACSYTFDSLTSSIKTNQIETLFSDTLEITVENK
jgi:hypothetical protein